jgi:hypothetical protein
LTLGLDYTFGIGAGFGAVIEHMLLDYGEVSALVLSYPVSLLDNLRGFVYFDWRSRDLYRMVSWQRTYDRWLWSVAAFWNPDWPRAFGGTAGAAGKGVMFTVAFNH